MPQSTVPHRHVLVRCEVTNRDAVSSVRFVEQDHYRLWQYMMANKHDLIVRNAAPCLWLTDTEYLGHPALFDLAGPCEPVSCLRFAVFDQTTGLCNTLQRFVPTNESEQLRDLLLRRVPPDLRASDDFVMEQRNGCAIIKAGIDGRRLGSPLEI